MDGDDRSTVSALTLDSRISNMEHDFRGMKTLLEQIASNQVANNRTASSPVSLSTTAGSGNAESANRV